MFKKVSDFLKGRYTTRGDVYWKQVREDLAIAWLVLVFVAVSLFVIFAVAAISSWKTVGYSLLFFAIIIVTLLALDELGKY
jgi:membrane protein YdbS with pleckstrin-like domain